MSEHYCLRCKTIRLDALPPHDPRITFFECRGCRRNYTLIPGRQLTFRWLHPISVVLYDVIEDPAPCRSAPGSFRTDPRSCSAEFLEEIRLELDEPTQQVRDILGSRTSEEELRRYLRLFLDHAERLQGEAPVRQEDREGGGEPT